MEIFFMKSLTHTYSADDSWTKNVSGNVTYENAKLCDVRIKII